MKGNGLDVHARTQELHALDRENLLDEGRNNERKSKKKINAL